MGNTSSTGTTNTTGAQFDPPITSVWDARVVFLNGPPGSGKDTGGKAIVQAFGDACMMKFAGPLKRAVHADFNLPPDTPDDFFENAKDVPTPALMGLAPRPAYIYKSEKDMKPRFGPDIYGLLGLRTFWREYQAGHRLFAVTDSGFAAEAEPLIKFVGADNCLLVRILADQRGKSFHGDSRSYIELPGVLTVSVSNDDISPAPFELALVNIVRGWLTADLYGLPFNP